jgi:hypothetical protein
MNSDTYWLNITNITLGVVTAICVLAILRGVVVEVFSRRSGAAGEDAEN